MSLLEVSGIDVYYGPSKVLHGATVDVAEGESVSIVGRNGMGKTTLIHSIMGLLKPASGDIRFSGGSLMGLRPNEIVKAGVTWMPQGRRVFGSLSVGENLIVSARRGQRKDKPLFGIDDVCDRFPLLRDRWRQNAATLSGGQQQILALARALLGNGRVVLLDEPSEGLDRANVARMLGAVRELVRRGVSMLMIEQRLAVAVAVADRVDVMVRGEVVATVDGASARADSTELALHMGFSVVD